MNGAREKASTTRGASAPSTVENRPHGPEIFSLRTENSDSDSDESSTGVVDEALEL